MNVVRITKGKMQEVVDVMKAVEAKDFYLEESGMAIVSKALESFLFVFWSGG